MSCFWQSIASRIRKSIARSCVSVNSIGKLAVVGQAARFEDVLGHALGQRVLPVDDLVDRLHHVLAPGGMYGRAYRRYCGNDRSRITSTRFRTSIVSGEGMREDKETGRGGDKETLHQQVACVACAATSSTRAGKMP